MIPMIPWRRRLIPLLPVAALVAIPSLAAQGGAFELKSRILERDPAVAASLERAGASPSDPAAWNDLGRILADRGAYADAAEAFERAVRLDPESSAYVSNRGAALLRQGDLRRALSLFERALEIEPFDAVAHYNLAIAHDELGNYDQALEAYRSAFILDPRLKDPAYNASVVNNEHMLAVGLEVYLKRAGATPALYRAADEEPAIPPDK